MIRKDYHMHCRFSTDSNARPEAMCEAALKKGLEEICFTDHQDYGFKIPGWFRFDPAAYFRKMKKVQEAYKDRLTVRIGVEIGLIPDDAALHDEIASFVRDWPWDFVIGSTHTVPVVIGGETIHVDPADPKDLARSWEYYGSTDALMSACYEAMLKNVEQYDVFDTLGHIDYMCRYVPAHFAPYAYEAHTGEIDRVLKAVIERGKAIEVNTGGLRKSIRRTNPEEKIVRRYLELGGTKLTYGSDAHTPSQVAYGFETLPAYPAEDAMVPRKNP